MAKARQSKVKGDLKAPRPCIAQGVRQQKGASPSKVRRQILNIFIIHIELISSYLVYYNIIMKCFSLCSIKKLGLSNYFKIGLTWFRLYQLVLGLGRYFGNCKWFLSIFSEFGGILLILEVLRIFWYFQWFLSIFGDFIKIGFGQGMDIHG